jgi:hypothetical protein
MLLLMFAIDGSTAPMCYTVHNSKAERTMITCQSCITLALHASLKIPLNYAAYIIADKHIVYSVTR